MSSIGPSYPATGADNGTGATWVNPGNVTAEDAAVATAAVTSTATGIKATNWSTPFAGMADSDIVDGIVYEILCDSTSSNISDNTIKLIIAGTVSGNNQSAALAWTLSVLTRQTYGSSSDSWGLSLTGADVKATNFGVQHLCTHSGKGSGAGTIDSMRLTVYYHAAAGGMPQRLVRSQAVKRAAYF